ncbi:MAG: hypothetical protein QOF43_1277 [Gaiellaceae bacterium]|nr:hypothetical protein [Gaiellaceae bacterium]
MNELLDRYVPPFDDNGDWSDVLRRAGRRRLRPRVLAAVVLAAAVLGVAPALAVLLRDGGVKLPDAADRSNVALVISPLSRRVVLQVAPWRGHDGFCYAVLRVRAGCVPHKARGTLVSSPPLFGWTFEGRVRTGVATTLAGKTVPLTVKRFGGRINVTIFLIRDRLPRLLRSVVLRDAHGRIVVRLKLR